LLSATISSSARLDALAGSLGDLEDREGVWVALSRQINECVDRGLPYFALVATSPPLISEKRSDMYGTWSNNARAFRRRPDLPGNLGERETVVVEHLDQGQERWWVSGRGVRNAPSMPSEPRLPCADCAEKRRKLLSATCRPGDVCSNRRNAPSCCQQLSPGRP